jgi:hypothetical protein
MQLVSVCFSYREKTSAYTFLQEYLTLYKSSIKTKQNMEKKAENERQETANLTKRVLKISLPQKIEKRGHILICYQNLRA